MAVDHVSFTMKGREVLALIGPNGAGKTTLFNLISGALPPDHGEVIFNDQNITGKPPHKLFHLGLSRSFQITNIFQGLTVFENLRLACQGKVKRFNLFISASRLTNTTREAEGLLDLLELGDKGHELAGNLSHGDQRYLEIGMALAAKPSLLLLDEPTAGMTPAETRTTIDLIERLRKDVTIFLIEHDIDMLLEVSDRMIVMQQGQVLAEGTPDEVKSNEAVQKAYFGEEL